MPLGITDTSLPPVNGLCRTISAIQLLRATNEIFTSFQACRLRRHCHQLMSKREFEASCGQLPQPLRYSSHPPDYLQPPVSGPISRRVPTIGHWRSLASSPLGAAPRPAPPHTT